MKPFYFDIETIPAQDPAIRAEIAASITAPAQFKKPESIAEWLKENRESEAEAQWLKTSFDGGVGHVVCIGWALGDGLSRSYAVGDCQDREQERQILQDFFCALTDAGHVQLVGHNIVGFDIPFLWKRAMVLGVKPPHNFPRNPKPWSELICDTMLLWDSTQRAGGSMDRICRLMGIPGKGDFGGADVWPAMQRGEYGRVEDYCRQDVERTRAMHKRMTFAEA
jgi:predicted PolB exonuclease-like 3'-5' exonuclease